MFKYREKGAVIMLNLKNGFELIENDSMLCCKYIGNRKYCFIQAIWLDTCKGDEKADNAKDDTDNFVVVSDIIDISEMSESDIEIAVSNLYDSISDMKSQGLSELESDWIIAEGAFNNKSDESDYEYVSEVVSWKNAEKIIQSFIDNNGNIVKVC